MVSIPPPDMPALVGLAKASLLGRVECSIAVTWVTKVKLRY